MRDRHAYGQLLIRVDLGRWHWDRLFQQVYYIPKGKRRPAWTLYLGTRENNESDALRAVVRALSPRRGGGKNVDGERAAQ